METRWDLKVRCLGHFHRGEVFEADRVATHAVEQHPDDGELWQIHGLICARLGDFEAACDALETAAVLVPLNPAAQCALAECHARAGRVDLARGLYRGLVRRPDCPTGLLPSAASGLGRIGDNESALEACHALARRDGRRHEAFFGIAYYMRLIGHDALEILPAAARAHELAPDCPSYRTLYASLLSQVGREGQARELLRGLRPDSVRCAGCLRRIMAILSRGDRADAAALQSFQVQAARLAGAGGPCGEDC
ncbi:tetratricopeptide repeat protein [Aquisphaera insulae]|uniref:tetratricopeptide repeat protein n=1 Tax=Aquisphaera insulae TaxID=2712864 RepID=UPI0013EE3995|nr:tetratricopeptide repeat protein [Aquisphaera insulae]